MVGWGGWLCSCRHMYVCLCVYGNGMHLHTCSE